MPQEDALGQMAQLGREVVQRTWSGVYDLDGVLFTGIVSTARSMMPVEIGGAPPGRKDSDGDDADATRVPRSME
jgi:hypothetical protein